MGSDDGTSTFPPSLAPGADAFAYDDEQSSESRLHAASPAVAVVVSDRSLRDLLAIRIQGGGHMVGGEDIVPGAAVIVTDAAGGAKTTVAGLRARTRTDAATIVILAASAPDAEVSAAYEAGALLCMRAPVDERQLLATIDSAIDLRTAKVHADDLMRQLDLHAHLASLGRVTAGFTHEVSNPLTVLATNLEAVRISVDKLLPAATDVRHALDDMGVAVERIAAILSTARTLARGSHGSRREDVDLASLVRDVRRWAQSELDGVDVQELIDEALVARADPRLLGQILLNLVTNAAHASRQLPSPRVRLHVYRSSQTAVVSVRDNGPGVPAEIRDRIFEPFFTTRRGQGGTGLGLALCREYATQMQARITLWTAPGRGACFRVHLSLP